MPYPLNNVTVGSDSYTDDATARMQLPADQAFVAVFNQSVYMQVSRVEQGMRADTGQWLAEEFMVPGAYTLRRGYLIGGLRFRRAVTGQNAQVTAR